MARPISGRRQREAEVTLETAATFRGGSTRIPGRSGCEAACGLRRFRDRSLGHSPILVNRVARQRQGVHEGAESTNPAGGSLQLTDRLIRGETEMKNLVNRFVREEEGQDLIEYYRSWRR